MFMGLRGVAIGSKDDVFLTGLERLRRTHEYTFSISLLSPKLKTNAIEKQREGLCSCSIGLGSEIKLFILTQRRPNTGPNKEATTLLLVQLSALKNERP